MNAPADLRGVWNTPHAKLGGLSLLDHLFNRLDGMYPGRWRNAFPGEDSIENWRTTWGEAFDVERITPDDVARGLTFCQRELHWPPSLAEFLQACRPALDVDAALYEAVEQMRLRAEGKDHWTHPAIYWAAVEITEHDLQSLGVSALRPRFEHALRELERRADLPPVPPRVLRLEHERGRAPESAAEKASMASIHELLPQCRPDPGKEWARKTVQQAEAGQAVPHNKLEIAKAALRNAGEL